MSVKLVEVRREGLVESVHRGSIVVADSQGNILYKAGDSRRVTFYRSSGKPLQAIAALETGIVEKYGLDLEEIAIMASSHSGKKRHIEVLENIMKKSGISSDEIKCGIHEPYDREAAKELYKEGQEPTNLHCNCSGKHLGAILSALTKGYGAEEYLDRHHPHQKEIVRIISEFSGVSSENIRIGTDGCSIPVYGLPLANMALSYAHLCDLGFCGGKYSKSQNYLISAMTMYPEMIAGNGRLDTELMKAYGDRLISKTGAEGVYCAGLTRKAVGIAIKIDDGNIRALGPVIMELLLSMHVITKEEAEKLTQYWKPMVFNHKGEKVGEIKACIRPEHIPV